MVICFIISRLMLWLIIAFFITLRLLPFVMP
jgi:hypothetical protein